MTLGRTMTLKELTDGGKAAMAEALAVLESSPDALQTISLLDAAYSAPRGRVPAIGRTVTWRVSLSTRTNTSGEAPTSVAEGSSIAYMYGAGLVTRNAR